MIRLTMAFAACTAMGVLTANAADMPVKAPRLPPPPVYTWTGCYLGANGGGGWAHKEYVDPLAVPPEALGSHSADGAVYGGQIGCDFQTGAWVVGVQGMIDGADLRGSHIVPGATDQFHTHIPFLATATARIGYAFQPSVLAYLKGGAAWVGDRETIIDLGVLEGRANFTRVGWTIGGGLEYQFWSNWSFFAEYDYLNFGRRDETFTNLEVPPVPPTFPINIRQDVHMFVVGVNYRFGIGPVTARY
jgi:outer membrane immunogenic protein